MASISLNKKPEPILEYLDYDLGSVKCTEDKQIILGSYLNMWIWPGKTYIIPTGVRFWFPDNSMGLILGFPFSSRFEVIPQLCEDDCEAWIKIKNPGFLPKLLRSNEMLATLTVIPKVECHIVSKGWS